MSRIVYSTETPTYVSQYTLYGGTTFIWTSDRAKAAAHARKGHSGKFQKLNPKKESK